MHKTEHEKEPFHAGVGDDGAGGRVEQDVEKRGEGRYEAIATPIGAFGNADLFESGNETFLRYVEDGRAGWGGVPVGIHLRGEMGQDQLAGLLCVEICY